MSLAGEVSTAIDLECVLWRTRGRNWDYDFILKPASPHSDGWYWMHRTVFGGMTPAQQPTYVRGALADENAEAVPFIGAAFLDPSRRDGHGRPIAHYVVWFRVGDTLDEVLSSTPAGWESAFLKQVAEVFDAPEVFNATVPSEGEGDSPRAVFSKGLEAAHGLVEVAGPALDRAACRDVGSVKKNSGPSQEPPKTTAAPTSWRIVAIAVFLALLLLAAFLFRTCTSQDEAPTTPQPATQFD